MWMEPYVLINDTLPGFFPRHVLGLCSSHVLGRARGRQLRRVSAVQLPGRAEQRRGRREAGQL